MVSYRNIIVFITILGMELSWLYALLSAANKAVSERLSIPLLLVVLIVSFGVSSAIMRIKWPRPALTALSWIVWPVAMLLMLKVQLFPQVPIIDTVWLASIPQAFSQIFNQFEPALFILSSSAALWWLGRRLAYIKIDFKAALIEFQIGLVLLVIVFFVLYQTNQDQSSSLPVVLAFFSLGLIGISISHAEENSSWMGSWRQGHWSSMLLISIALILMVGVLISVVITPDLLRLFLRALQWFWGLIERVLAFLASLLPEQTAEPLPEMPPMSVPEDQGREVFNLPDWFRPGAQLAWTVVAGGLFLVALWRVMSQIIGWMRQRKLTGGGEVESLRGAFKLDLFNWFKRLLSRLFGIKFGLPNRERYKNVPAEIASVRHLYSQLLRWAGDKGYARQQSQTPHEYQNVINEVIFGNHDELDFITREYINVRYGLALPTAEELNHLKQTWHNLRKTELKKPHNRDTQDRG